jgi:hypothetical protein
MNRRTPHVALLVVAPLFVLACGRHPLEPGDLERVPPPDAGAVATPLPDAGEAVETLDGVWSGQLAASSPGITWGPYDRLTIGFAPDSTVTALQWASNFPPTHTFGSGPLDYPLQGQRDARLTGASIYTVRVTVETADFGPSRFHLRYRVVGTGQTPDTNYVVDVSGQLDGGVLDVAYSATGRLLAVALAARASGELRRGG